MVIQPLPYNSILQYRGTMVAWYHANTVPWHYGTLAPWYRGTIVLWCRDTMVPWDHGTMAPWYRSTMVSSCHDTMVPRFRGIIVPWCVCFSFSELWFSFLFGFLAALNQKHALTNTHFFVFESRNIVSNKKLDPKIHLSLILRPREIYFLSFFRAAFPCGPWPPRGQTGTVLGIKNPMIQRSQWRR